MGSPSIHRIERINYLLAAIVVLGGLVQTARRHDASMQRGRGT